MFVDRYRRAALGSLAAVAIAVVGPAVFAQSAPPAPTGLASAVQGSTVTLAWSPGAGTVTPVLYQIEAGSGPGASDLVVSVVQTPGVVAANVRNGLYFVRVRAANAAGVSAPSNEIAVRVGCVTAPTVPVGLVTQVSGTTVAVAWQPSAGATGYVLEAGSAPGAANLAMVPLGTPSLLASVPPGTYYVRVRAQNACGSSAPSGEAVLNVGGGGPAPAPTPIPPPAPGPAPPPSPTSNSVVIANATMDPSSIGVGQTATLRWTTSSGGDPRTITIEPGIGRVPATARSWPVTPTGTTLYLITFNQADGSFPNDVPSYRHVTVTVTGAATPPPPTPPPTPPPPPPPPPPPTPPPPETSGGSRRVKSYCNF